MDLAHLIVHVAFSNAKRLAMDDSHTTDKLIGVDLHNLLSSTLIRWSGTDLRGLILN